MSSPDLPEATLRTFVAVELPEAVLQALTRVQAGLGAQAARAGVHRGVRWVDPVGVHLTLKFLGETPRGLVPEIGSRLGAALAGRARFRLELSVLGVFPNARAPRVIWVGLTGALAELAGVQREVERAIAPLGYPSEARPFSPHLTLARVGDAVGPPDRQILGELVRGYGPAPAAPFEVAGVSLIRSELTPAGARYSRMVRVGLA